MAIVGRFTWASRLTSSVLLGGRLGARGLALSPKPARGRWTALLGAMSGGKSRAERFISLPYYLRSKSHTRSSRPATYQSHLARVAAQGRALFGFRYDGTEETATRRRAVTLEPLRCGWPSLRSVFHPSWPNCDFQNRRTTKLRRATGVRANQHLAHPRRAGADT